VDTAATIVSKTSLVLLEEVRPVDLRRLRSVVAVADHASFVAAAAGRGHPARHGGEATA